MAMIAAAMMPAAAGAAQRALTRYGQTAFADAQQCFADPDRSIVVAQIRLAADDREDGGSADGA